MFGDLQNRTPEEAAEMLTKAGYTVENTILYDFSDVVPENMVCEYMLLDENGQIIEEKRKTKIIILKITPLIITILTAAPEK